MDQVLIAGGTQEEVTEFKNTEVTEKVGESIRNNGDDPGLFAQLLRFAIDVLTDFLDLLMKKQQSEVLTVITEASDKEYKKARLEFLQMNTIHQKLNKCNRKLYALQKRQKALSESLNTIPKDLFHRKERRAAETTIEGLQRQIELTRSQLEMIPKQNGFDDVKSAEAAYKAAKGKMETLKVQLGIVDDPIETMIKPQSQEQKISALKELAARRLEIQNSDYYEKHSCKEKQVKTKYRY